MFDELIRRWWIVALRGLVSILLGVDLFIEPVGTLWVLVSAFGLLALADGIFAAGAGLAAGWLPAFLYGLIGMVVGGFTYLYPAAVEVWFVGFVVAWALVTGGLGVIAARALRPSTRPGAWLLGLHGLTSLAFGTTLALRSDLGAWPAVLGLYAVVSGALLVGFAMAARALPGFPRRAGA